MRAIYSQQLECEQQRKEPEENIGMGGRHWGRWILKEQESIDPYGIHMFPLGFVSLRWHVVTEEFPPNALSVV